MEKVARTKRNFTIAASLLLAFSCSSAITAHADSTPSPAPSSSTDPFKVANEQFKHDREIFIAAMHDREMKIRDINSLFKTAVDKANSDARTAMSTASTPLQKSTIFSNRRNAIDAAINARDLAITALGAMPIPPTQPLRQPKTMGNNKSNAGQNH